MEAILTWFYSLELHEVLALYLGGSLILLVMGSLVVLEYQENKLKREELRMFQDEDGIPRFMRATDEQIGL